MERRTKKKATRPAAATNPFKEPEMSHDLLWQAERIPGKLQLVSTPTLPKSQVQLCVRVCPFCFARARTRAISRMSGAMAPLFAKNVVCLAPFSLCCSTQAKCRVDLSTGASPKTERLYGSFSNRCKCPNESGHSATKLAAHECWFRFWASGPL